MRLSVRFSSRQWLLQLAKIDTEDNEQSFSPLFIAAMVATTGTSCNTRRTSLLSVRFSSRQWLLPHIDFLYGERLDFQSAFHRGNGCYFVFGKAKPHIISFQSAFHRGNGCYSKYIWHSPRAGPFSPLFIAAMVATTTKYPQRLTRKAFSPLFIAAMVATILWNLAEFGLPSFSPLFIAAMVATNPKNSMIAVQKLIFQSAFHRGNGCYFIRIASNRSINCAFSPLFIAAMVATSLELTLYQGRIDFQSAFHRGNGCYQMIEKPERAESILSVRFSSRQWLLLSS